MNRNDACGGVLIFLFGALTVYLSLKMPIGTFRAAGPGLFPLCLGLLRVVLSAAFTLAVVLRLRRAERREGEASGGSGSAKPVLGFMAAIAFAAGLLEHIGYAPTAFTSGHGTAANFGRSLLAPESVYLDSGQRDFPFPFREVASNTLSTGSVGL